MADTNSTIATLESLGASIVPQIVGALLTKYEPTCDVQGAETAVYNIVVNAIALQKAIEVRATATETTANA